MVHKIQHLAVDQQEEQEDLVVEEENILMVEIQVELEILPLLLRLKETLAEM
jgi:hypothetical protein|tara:strand:- start:397 stop:552 length:156 start_codon:yes stop_codon:yes gene_type:complete